jgi:hypothetical protein
MEVWVVARHNKKDFAQCIFCSKIVPSGIKRFKQHIASGFGDTMKCARVPELVSKEMHMYLKRNMRLVITDNIEGEEGEERNDEGPEPSSGTKNKQAKKKIAQTAMSSFLVSVPPKLSTQKASKSMSAMLCKTPEVVAERHKNKTSQATLKHCAKKGTQAQQIVDDHVVDFLYENKIPLNVVNSRS